MQKTALDFVATVLAVLAAVALGLSAGAMLAEGALLVVWWRSLPPQTFLSWYAENASRLVTFYGPLETAGAGLAVAAGALYQYQRRAGRGLFITSALLALAVVGAFFVYFQRANASFAAGTIPVDDVADELARFAVWHWSRIVIGTLAFIAAVLGVRAAGGRGPVPRDAQ